MLEQGASVSAWAWLPSLHPTSSPLCLKRTLTLQMAALQVEDIILSETAIDFAMKAKNPLDRKSASVSSPVSLPPFL